MPSNQRKYPRFPMSGLVVLKVPEKHIQTSGTIEQVSMKGMGVYTKEKFEVGTPVILEMVSFMGTSTLNYVLKGTVRNNGRHNEFGVLGIEFDKEISPADQPHLYEYLSNQTDLLNSRNKTG